MPVAALLLVGLVLLVAVQYFRGRLGHRVCAWGRDTYIRFYPNPGFGVSFSKARAALSMVGGLEVYRRHPSMVWIRMMALGSRRKGVPGGKH